jgi:hypothetical protein
MSDREAMTAPDREALRARLDAIFAGSDPKMDGSSVVHLPKYGDGSPGKVTVHLPQPIVALIRQTIDALDHADAQDAALAEARREVEAMLVVSHERTGRYDALVRVLALLPEVTAAFDERPCGGCGGAGCSACTTEVTE